MAEGLIVDRSNNNAGPVDWAKAKEEGGVIAVILKASEGETFVDPTYAPQLAGALELELPVLGYHFAHFTNIAKEAALFKSVAGARARILDSEMNTSIAQQNAFLAALNLPADEELDYGSASTLPRSGIRALLWPASYGKNFGFGDCWQFTDAQVVPGMPGKVDASRWIGSDADFDALFNITAPVTLPNTILRFPDLQEVPLTQAEFYVWVRYLWYVLRKDALPAGEQSLLWQLLDTPVTGKVLGSAGFGGNLDLVLANIHDTAGSNLR